MNETHKLYQLDNKGKLRVWWVQYEGDQYRIFAGIEGGTLVMSAWTTCLPKNVGKKNEVTAEGQCVSEVMALWNKKLKGKYTMDPSGIPSHGKTFPMLAQTWVSWEKLPIDHTRPANLIQVLSQPKLNGVRCVARKDGLWSRKGEPLDVPHISVELEPFFDAFPDAILDGELYLHDLRDDLGQILSMVRHGDQTLQYHVYDLVDTTLDFQQRSQWLMVLDRYVGPCVLRVQTHFAPTQLALDCHRDRYLAEGYEGQIVRMAKSKYEPGKRSPYLVKRKEWQDAEFTIVGFNMGKGNYGDVYKTATCLTEDGKEFFPTIKGNKKYLAALTIKHLYFTGKLIGNVKFFALSPDGIPLFCTLETIYGPERDL